MKTTLITRMGSFILGGGTGVAAALAGLALWTGTTDLQAIKSLVENHMTDTEQQVSAFVQDYQVQVDNANAEIGEYKDALEQANSNISQLITAYNNAETKHQTELENANKQAEQDLADLQAELDKLYVRMDSQYETDMNAVVEQANAQINAANQEVAETKRYIEEDVLPTSQIDEYIKYAKDYGKVNTGGDKTVTDISSIVPQE